MEWGTVKLGYRVNGYTEITIDPDISKGEDQQQMDVTSSPHRVVISSLDPFSCPTMRASAVRTQPNLFTTRPDHTSLHGWQEGG